MGLLIVVLTASVHGYDVLADPLGWLLVLAGLSRLPSLSAGAVTTLAGLSFLVSVVVWWPAARDALNVTDPSLAWAASLPELATAIALAHGLAREARTVGDRSATAWLRTARTLLVVVVLLPPVVIGGGLDQLRGTAALVGSASLVLLVVLLFGYAGRPWATPPAGPAGPPGEPGEPTG